MLNLRLYRGGCIPVLLCLFVAAFSLRDRPRGVETTLSPDAFDGPAATRTLQGLARSFPSRRAGSAGDDALAARVQAGFVRSFGAGRVRERRFHARTIDGERDLISVIAERP